MRKKPGKKRFTSSLFKQKEQKGFGSLSEIAIAVVIISTGILGTLALLSTSHREMLLSREYIIGEAIALEIVEKLKIIPYDHLKTTGGQVPAETLDSLLSLNKISDDLPGLKRFVEVEEDEGVKTITVTVTWKTKGKEGPDAEGKLEYVFYRTPYF